MSSSRQHLISARMAVISLLFAGWTISAYALQGGTSPPWSAKPKPPLPIHAPQRPRILDQP